MITAFTFSIIPLLLSVPSVWKQYGTYGGRNTAYACRTAKTKTQQQRRRIRIVDENNTLKTSSICGNSCFIRCSVPDELLCAFNARH